jgi:hypothetical protein
MIRSATIDEDMPPSETQARGPRCPACNARARRLTHRLLDSRTGKTIRVYHCQCGEWIWDD